MFLSLPGLVSAQKSVPKRSADLEHIREELGVNEFTAPSIDLIFDQLESLKPIPFDKAWRDLPEATPQDRTRLALSAGQVIADGFLAVSARKQSRLEPVGRVLLKLAKGLGIGDPITRHSRSLIELAAREQWPQVKRELIKAQAEVEAGMMALKDEEIAHLVSLGGWLRGLEMTASIVMENYTPERARAVIQPELFDYFTDRLETLNPMLKKTELMGAIIKNLGLIRTLTRKPVDSPIEPAELKQIRDLAREQAVLDARKAQAEQLHLPPNVIESIWRLLMLASRDHQASLR
ncbi:MAG: chorismate mutase, partial [Verrucomicrobiota bacterium]